MRGDRIVVEADAICPYKIADEVCGRRRGDPPLKIDA
jgi:hypothetical protein